MSEDRKAPYTDNNGRVPLRGANGAYHLLQEYPTWIFHTMAAGQVLDGTAPATATTTPTNTNPIVRDGRTEYLGLNHGGLFVLPGNYKRGTVVDEVSNPASATITIVNPLTGTFRALPATKPFTIAPGEYLKAVGGTAGEKVGFMITEFIPRR